MMSLKDLVLPPWEDPEVQLVYEQLCEVGEPPGGDHWEGWVARHIVYARRAKLTRMETIERAVEIIDQNLHNLGPHASALKIIGALHVAGLKIVEEKETGPGAAKAGER
jgi:hypothetical protein